MKYKELIKNSSAGVLLRASYVALEGYLLFMLVSNSFGIVNVGVTRSIHNITRLWITNAAIHFIAVLLAYLVMNAVVNRWRARLSKGTIVAVTILVVTFLLALLSQVVWLHIATQFTRASFN